jgi:uncharacterized membrane protein (DUF485 family)
MENKDNILTGYCFLAALTENQNDLFNHVFVPICKRSLSLYSLNGSTHGKAEDIKELIYKEYGINIPLIMVKKLINATFKSLSNKDKKVNKAQIFQNGASFEIDKYSFSDLEIQYRKGARNANALQLGFVKYLEEESIEDLNNVPPFSSFLEKNKKKLAGFFKSNPEQIIITDSTFLYHVHFLEYIETNSHELFEIAKSLYIGSVVAGFLEAGLDLEPKFDSQEEYYLDTPVILQALDLQKEEDTVPIRELLELIKGTGGKIKILSITIDEVHGVIDNAIRNFNTNTPTSTINEACLRLNKNKTWLINFNGKLEDKIAATLNSQRVAVSSTFIEKHFKSPDVKVLQGERMKKGNALHDVLSYLFVRNARGGFISTFQKAKIWFLTTNIKLLKFNLNNKPHNGVPELVLPDSLAGLLWLKNPSALLSKVKVMGLAELMANTLNEEIASKELINEFENSISKIEGIDEDDYKILLESVAHQSAKRVEAFNEIAITNLAVAKVEAHKIVEKERAKRAKITKVIKEAHFAKKEEELHNKELAEYLAKIEYELEKTKGELLDTKTTGDVNKTELEKLSEKVEIQEIKRKTQIRWSIIGFSVLMLVALVYILKINFYQSLEVLKLINNWILSAGALFGFGSFAINFYKFVTGN